MENLKIPGLEDLEIPGLEDLKILGLEDPKMFGLEDLKILGLADLKICGLGDLKIFGFRDLQIQDQKSSNYVHWIIYFWGKHACFSDCIKLEFLIFHEARQSLDWMFSISLEREKKNCSEPSLL